MRKLTLYAAAAALLALGACNITKNGVTRVSGSSGTNQATPASTTTPGKAAGTIDENALAGEWTIVAVGSTQITDREEMPYINFDNGRFYGSNGCNILNGSYRIDGSKIAFGGVASTMRYCPDVPFEHDINVVLADGTSYPVKIENTGHETYIYFLGGSGQKLLTARRHNMGFLNGQWQVTAIDGQAIDDEECNIFFDIAEGRVHGNTGCNYFNGSIFINPDRSNSIELSNMGVTRMACPKTAQETAMLVALEQTTTAIQGSGNRVMLLDKDGKQVITLLRSEIQKTDK
ncbi:MAG: META domain-containing protein [Muribaculaceae bacterium]|nr:META domain-containing protein [Muribaculaceae bacterium]